MTNIIQNSIDFLTKEQQPNGSFPSLISASKNFKNAKSRPTIFFTTLILQSLNTLTENKKIKTLKQKAANFLLSQKNEHWSFNYWARQSPEFKTIPYPDDLDDTSCALAALFKYNPELIDGSALGKFVMLLTALEKKEGGPYKTWLVKPNAEKVWQDVDLAVNSNIAYFLSLQDVTLPNLTDFIEQAIETKKFYSPYYASPYSVIYFISKFYQGNKVGQIINFLFEQQNKQKYWNNPLDTALAVLTLFNYNVEPKKLEQSITYLSENQKKGSWKPYPFVVDLIKKKTTYYAGSATLTTAFCMEAIFNQKNKKTQNLSRTAIREHKNKIKYETISKNDEEIMIYDTIIKALNKNVSTLDNELKKQTQKILNKTLANNKDKTITLLPYFFKTALGENGKKISDQQITQLGLANIYGWAAYTIYDDFLDDEGDPKMISTANFLLRELTIIFNNIINERCPTPYRVSDTYGNFFSRIMNSIDAANTWETTNCRARVSKGKLIIPKKLPNYGDYSKLAERSMGHALGPIAILALLGYNEKSAEIKNITSFFKHYIIARQLNDDAHDWEEDLKVGHLDAVGVAVLKKWQEVETHCNASLQNILPRLQQIFWHEVVVDICNDTLKHIELAKQSLRQIEVITNPSILENLLKPVIHSAKKALKEREETIKFLKVYT